MRFKKYGGKIFDVELTKSEQKAMNQAINEQIAELYQKSRRNIVALILWNIHKQFGFGKKRLYRFYKDFDKEIEKLIRYYEMDDDDGAMICVKLLRTNCGIDLEEWEKEGKE